MTADARIIVGDWVDVLRSLADASAQCCVTSPPYWGLRDYGVGGQLGLEASPEEYVARLVAGFREVRRVLKPDGVVWLNLGDCHATGAGAVGNCPSGGEQGARCMGDALRDRDPKRGYRGDRLANGRGDSDAALRKKTTGEGRLGPVTQPNRMPIPGLKPKDLVGMPWRVALALQADGWWLRSDCVWSKPNPMPESVTDRPTRSHEYVFLLAASEIYYYDADAVKEAQVYGDHRRQVYGDHRRNAGGRAWVPPGQTESGISRRRRSGNKARSIADGAAGARPGDHLGSGVPWQDVDGRRNRRTVWTVATRGFAGAHFATFPEEIARVCVLSGSRPGDVVLDPFLGAGTTALVALAAGRRAVGSELNPAYAKLALDRIEGQLGLLYKTSIEPVAPQAPAAEEPKVGA